MSYVGAWDQGETSEREKIVDIFFKGSANRISGQIGYGV